MLQKFQNWTGWNYVDLSRRIFKMKPVIDWADRTVKNKQMLLKLGPTCRWRYDVCVLLSRNDSTHMLSIWSLSRCYHWFLAWHNRRSHRVIFCLRKPSGIMTAIPSCWTPRSVARDWYLRWWDLPKLSIPYSPCMEYLLTFSNINLGKCRQIGKYSIHGAFGHCYVMFTMVVWAYLLAVTARLAYHPFAAVFVETFHAGELVHHVAFAKTLSVGRCMLLLDLSNCTQLQSQP